MNIDTGRGSDNSQVFLVRLWANEAPHQCDADANDGTARTECPEGIGESGGTAEGQGKVQGKVTHLLSGKASSFTDGADLMSLLTNMMFANDKEDLREEISEAS